MNVYDDAGRQLGSVMRITPTRALFRFGTGAPHEDLAEQLQEIGLTVYGHGACAALGDYCLIEATEAEAARLCDCLAGMTAAPSREERYPRLLAAAQKFCDDANEAEIRGQSAALAFAETIGVKATDYDAEWVMLFIPTGVEPRGRLYEEFIILQDSRGVWGVTHI